MIQSISLIQDHEPNLGSGPNISLFICPLPSPILYQLHDDLLIPKRKKPLSTLPNHTIVSRFRGILETSTSNILPRHDLG